MSGDITLAQQIDEVAREVAARRRLYPVWVAAGTLARDTAERRLAAMEAVLAALRRLDQPELPL